MDGSRTVSWSVAPGATRAWLQRIGGLASLPDLVRQLGGDPRAVLAGSGLAESAFASLENNVPYSALVEVLNRAAQHTGCAHFGLLLGRMYGLAQLGVVGDLVRHSRTAGDALEAFTVYQHLNSEGALAFLLKRGDFVDFGYALYDPTVPRATQMYDAALAVGMNFMTELCGPHWRPYDVFLAHERPRDVAPYHVFFKVVPRFNAEYCAVRFRATDLSLPVPGADEAMYRRAQQRVQRLGRPEFLQQVYRGLRRLMLDNRHSGDDLAQALAMHRRTLNRRLKAEGVTFQQVLDAIRFEIARDLLSNTNVHLDDVSATLGYAAVTTFMRTFRRWSGTTPGQWRRAVRGSPDAVPSSRRAAASSGLSRPAA